MEELKIKSIIAEAEARGLAFVEDDYTEEEGIYNPTVNREEALQWLGDILNNYA